MNKATLALKLSERMDIPRKQGEEFIELLQEIITDTLSKDESVTIAGFGTFSSRIRSARKGVNPRKPDEIIDVPAVKVPKFKAGKALKDALKASMHGAKPEQEEVREFAAPEVPELSSDAQPEKPFEESEGPVIE